MPHDEAHRVEQKAITYPVPGNKIDGGVACSNSEFQLNMVDGLRSKANLAILDMSHRDFESSKRIAVGNFGANLNFSPTNGFDVGIDADLLRASYEGERFKVGTGLNYSTGIKYQPGAVKLHFMGYGFEYDEDGVGIRIPTFDIKFKWFNSK